MKGSVMDLGRLLAFLENSQAGKKQEISDAKLNESDREILAWLRQRIQALESSKDLPDRSSDSSENFDDACLEKAIDILLFKLFIDTSADDKDPSNPCNQLFRELNDNYHCFERYSDLLRSYYNASQKPGNA